MLKLLPEPGRPVERVSVLVFLESWDPIAQPGVEEWLTKLLEQMYRSLGRKSADALAALVRRGRISPILDGLDEVPPERAAGIVAALNKDPAR